MPTGGNIEDAQTINDLIEREVCQAPEQYLWIHRRFKIQPDSKKQHYKKGRSSLKVQAIMCNIMFVLYLERHKNDFHQMFV